MRTTFANVCARCRNDPNTIALYKAKLCLLRRLPHGSDSRRFQSEILKVHFTLLSLFGPLFEQRARQSDERNNTPRITSDQGWIRCAP